MKRLIVLLMILALFTCLFCGCKPPKDGDGETESVEIPEIDTKEGRDPSQETSGGLSENGGTGDPENPDESGAAGETGRNNDPTENELPIMTEPDDEDTDRPGTTTGTTGSGSTTQPQPTQPQPTEPQPTTNPGPTESAETTPPSTSGSNELPIIPITP